MTTPREHVLQSVLQRINEHNYHVCGANWRWLCDLVDSDQDGVYGDLADWVAAIACESVRLPVDDDHIEALRPHLPGFAAKFLGLTQPQWAAIEHLPLERTRQVLMHLLDCERRISGLVKATADAARMRAVLDSAGRHEEARVSEREFFRLFNEATECINGNQNRGGQDVSESREGQ